MPCVDIAMRDLQWGQDWQNEKCQCPDNLMEVNVLKLMNNQL